MHGLLGMQGSVATLDAAWIPFLSPMPAPGHLWPLLLVPLAFCIAVIYKALRLPTLDRYWRAVAIMTTQIVLGMVALGLALAILVQAVIPMLPVE